MWIGLLATSPMTFDMAVASFGTGAGAICFGGATSATAVGGTVFSGTAGSFGAPATSPVSLSIC